MANIAFFHNALGKTDGVSLEVDKWRYVLERMGHTVFYCAGNDDVKHVHCIPELSFMHPVSLKILQNATVKLQDFSEKELEKAIYQQKDVIKTQLLEFIRKNKIDILIPNNLLSVGYHLPALVALSEVIEETGLPTIAHNHDFYFEDSGEVNPTCPTAWRILDTYSPPTFPNVQNIVINRLAQKALLSKKRIKSMVVPNVFDFKQDAWVVDSYNADFRESFGIEDNDLVFLQATRVMDRKGIELAIDVVGELNKPENREKLYAVKLYNGRQFTKKSNIVLLCAGRIEKFGATDDYTDRLERRAKEKNVDIRFIGDFIKHSRGRKKGRKVYSLWDSYVHADIVTYPSFWEGWGNQFIEAVFAKLPIVIFEYPVWRSDLARVGFDVISLGHTLQENDVHDLVTVTSGRIARAVKKIIPVLTSRVKRKHMVEKNFDVASEQFSFETLEKIIKKLMGNIR